MKSTFLINLFVFCHDVDVLVSPDLVSDGTKISFFDVMLKTVEVLVFFHLLPDLKICS